jgi:hypothetical protein
MCDEERPVYSHVTFKLRSHVGWDGRRDGKRERGKDNFERIYNLEKRSNEALRKLRHKVIRHFNIYTLYLQTLATPTG